MFSKVTRGLKMPSYKNTSALSSYFKVTGSLDSSRLVMSPVRPDQLKPKPHVKDLTFGSTFTDHMLRVKWTAAGGWEAPRITGFENLSLHPAAKALHYAQEAFEGMKAYRGVDGRLRMFRPLHNMSRLRESARRCCLPSSFEEGELLKCIMRLVQLDGEWVPGAANSSLYIRPTLIGTDSTVGLGPAAEAELFVILSPTGPYYGSSSEIEPIRLLADPAFTRAWPGGCGPVKMGSNYAPTLAVAAEAARRAGGGCQQVLWLFGEDHEVTEAGAMNVFVLWENEATGRTELVTPPLDSGMILPGVTRRSILELASQWGQFEVAERKLTMPELVSAAEAGRLREMLACGTAAIVSPVGGVHYGGRMISIPTPEDGVAQRLLGSLSDIYYGRASHHWAVDIDATLREDEEETSDEGLSQFSSM